MKQRIKILFRDSQFMVTFLVALVCLFLSLTFPVDNGSLAQLLTKSIFFLVIIPALYIKMILKKDLSDFGLNIKNKEAGITTGILLLVILVLTYYVLFTYTSLQKKYLLPDNVVAKFPFFLLYELFLMNILLFSYEFFYRGFLLSAFSEKFGYWAILFQGIISILFFTLSNGFFWQFCALNALSFTNGFLAYRSKSFIFPYILSLLFIIIMDSYIIYSIHYYI